jgi:hypothetical protein
VRDSTRSSTRRRCRPGGHYADHGPAVRLTADVGPALAQGRKLLIDRRISGARLVDGTRSAELGKHVGEFMARINGHPPVSRLADGIRLAVIHIRLGAVQSAAGRRLAGFRVRSLDAGEAEHVIKGAILEHQHEYVLHQLAQKCPAWRLGIHRDGDGQRMTALVPVVPHSAPQRGPARARSGGQPGRNLSRKQVGAGLPRIGIGT